VNPAALAEWIASLDSADRSMLAATIRAGVGALQPLRRRNGTAYDPTAPNAVLAELAKPHDERYRSLSGQIETRWSTITSVHRNGTSGGSVSPPSVPTLRRWAESGRVHARKVGKTWELDLDDLERELRKATR
jgi:hypothetical protein